MAIIAAAALIAALATGQPVGPDHVGCNVTEMFSEHLHPHLTIEHGATRVRCRQILGS